MTAVIPITPRVLLNQHSLVKLRVGSDNVQWIENEVLKVKVLKSISNINSSQPSSTGHLSTKCGTEVPELNLF